MKTNARKSQFLNLRPYSWIDLVLLGLLAKFSIMQKLQFDSQDLLLAGGLLSLWFFFNLALEFKHGYDYRAKSSLLLTVFFLLVGGAIGYFINLTTLVFVLSSTILVLVYLQKASNKALGLLSSIVRGGIEASYFLYAVAFYATLSPTSWIIGLVILLSYFSRAIVGDIRDYPQNKKSNKQTLPLVFGLSNARLLTALFLAGSIVILALTFGNWLIFLPLILFASAILLYSNGYVLHQLAIATTSFTSINLIALFTGQNLLFTNLIYLGIFLNFIYYPLLERKSNPKFVQ